MEIGSKNREFEISKLALTEIESKGNKFWFKQSVHVGSKNQGFQKLGFHCIYTFLYICCVTASGAARQCPAVPDCFFRTHCVPHRQKSAIYILHTLTLGKGGCKNFELIGVLHAYLCHTCNKYF